MKTPEVTDYKSLVQAREYLETELHYHKAAMQLELNRAIDKVSVLSLLFNGLRGIGKKEDPDTVSATIKTLLGNFLTSIIARFFSPVGKTSNWKVMLSGLFSQLFARNKEKLVQRIFSFIFKRGRN